MDHIPPFDKVYNLVLKEKTQRNLWIQSQTMLDSSAMTTVKEEKKSFEKDIVCSRYNKKGYIKKNYKHIGFPEDLKFNKRKNAFKKGKSVNSVSIVEDI